MTRLAKNIATVFLCLAISIPCAWFLLWCGITRGFYRGDVEPGSPWLSVVAPVENVLRSTPATDRWRKNYVRNQLPPMKYHPMAEEFLRQNPSKDPRGNSLFIFSSAPPRDAH